jgi:hypothetical protein
LKFPGEIWQVLPRAFFFQIQVLPVIRNET